MLIQMASLRRFRRKSCEGKKRHSCYENARIAAWKTRQIAIDGGHSIHTYLCKFCKYWHVGHRSHKFNYERR